MCRTSAVRCTSVLGVFPASSEVLYHYRENIVHLSFDVYHHCECSLYSVTGPCDQTEYINTASVFQTGAGVYITTENGSCVCTEDCVRTLSVSHIWTEACVIS